MNRHFHTVHGNEEMQISFVFFVRFPESMRLID